MAKQGKKNQKFGRNKDRGQAKIYANQGRLLKNKEKAIKKDSRLKEKAKKKWENKKIPKRGSARKKKRIGMSRKFTTVIAG